MGRNSLYLKYGKRLVDILGGLVGTIFLFIPAFLLIALTYQFGKNKGPIFFRHRRLGKDGKQFDLIKFRSMVVDAEKVLRYDEALYKKYIENSYKLPPNEDPRLTSIGHFIRKTSIDELPQFLNILKGDMSLIGPRPIPMAELLQEYSTEKQIEFLSVKPGATGWWQVSGRSNVFYPERCDVELYYAQNISFKLDVKIILLTVKSVILKIGAH